MPAIPVIAAVGAAAIKSDSARKAAHTAADAAKEAAKAAQVNIPELQTQAQNIAAQNAERSAQLERQYNPGAQELRAGSLQSLLAAIPQTSQVNTLLNQIGSGAGQPLNAALLNSAIARAQENLNLGGKLDTETQNAVTRAALAKAGTVARGGGLGLGRDITARDLGLTSLDLQRQRLQDATNLGQLQAGLEQYSRSDLINSANLINSINQGTYQRALNAAGLGQSISSPQSGLDPGSIANLAVGNANANAAGIREAGQYNAQAGQQRGAFASSALGALGSAYGGGNLSFLGSMFTPKGGG